MSNWELNIAEAFMSRLDKARCAKAGNFFMQMSVARGLCVVLKQRGNLFSPRNPVAERPASNHGFSASPRLFRRFLSIIRLQHQGDACVTDYLLIVADGTRGHDPARTWARRDLESSHKVCITKATSRVPWPVFVGLLLRWFIVSRGISVVLFPTSCEPIIRGCHNWMPAGLELHDAATCLKLNADNWMVKSKGRPLFGLGTPICS